MLTPHCSLVGYNILDSSCITHLLSLSDSSHILKALQCSGLPVYFVLLPITTGFMVPSCWEKINQIRLSRFFIKYNQGQFTHHPPHPRVLLCLCVCNVSLYRHTLSNIYKRMRGAECLWQSCRSPVTLNITPTFTQTSSCIFCDKWFVHCCFSTSGSISLSTLQACTNEMNV